MELVIAAAVTVVAVFAFTVAFGSPYVRTHKGSIETALDLLEVEKGSHILDLGSGDGAVLLAAAKRGANATGYELNPFLVVVSLWRTRKHRQLVSIHWGNFWKVKITNKTQNIFMFLDSRFISRVDQMIIESGAKIDLASYSYEIPGKKPVAKKKGVILYRYG